MLRMIVGGAVATLILVAVAVAEVSKKTTVSGDELQTSAPAAVMQTDANGNPNPLTR